MSRVIILYEIEVTFPRTTVPGIEYVRDQRVTMTRMRWQRRQSVKWITRAARDRFKIDSPNIEPTYAIFLNMAIKRAQKIYNRVADVLHNTRQPLPVQLELPVTRTILRLSI